MSQPADMTTRRGGGKSATAYRTISEVSDELSVPQHVLRFWETKFGQVRPLKRGGGRRYYRPEDIDLLREIQRLLYEDGYTIKGVQKLLREGQVKPKPADRTAAVAEPAAQPVTEPAPPAQPSRLPQEVRTQLTALLEDLRALRDALRGPDPP